MVASKRVHRKANCADRERIQNVEAKAKEPGDGVQASLFNDSRKIEIKSEKTMKQLNQIKLPFSVALAMVCVGLSPILLTGCLSAKGVVGAMSKLKDDGATFNVHVTGWGVNIDVTRSNPLSNTPPYTVTRDGTVSVSDRRTTGAMP